MNDLNVRRADEDRGTLRTKSDHAVREAERDCETWRAQCGSKNSAQVPGSSPGRGAIKSRA